MTKEQLFKQVKFGKTYSDAWMNNLLSKANLQAEEFLIFENLNQNENLKKHLLTEEFQTRKLEDSFFKTTDKEIERLESKPVKDWEDHLNLLKLNRQIYHYPNRSPRINRGNTTIQKMNKNLDLFFLLEKATIINEKIFRKRILKNENHEVESDLKAWRIASEKINHLAIDYYRKRFGYTKENMLKEYRELKADFIHRFKELNSKEQQVHILSLLNDSTYLRKMKLLEIVELLPLYKLGLQFGILTPKKSISPATFAIVVSVSNNCNEFQYTNDFIEKYTNYLPIEFRTDAKTWGNAHTELKKGNLEKSLDISLSRDFSSYYFQKTSKVLKLQIYFDLFLNSSSYQSHLMSFCDAFEKWIRRDDSKSDFSKTPYLHLIQKCRALAKIHSDPDFNKEKLMNIFENVENIHAMKWLTEKQKEIFELRT